MNNHQKLHRVVAALCGTLACASASAGLIGYYEFRGKPRCGGASLARGSG